jgi:hydrogenase-4 component E
MFLAHVNPLQASIFSSLAILSLLLTFVMLGSHWLRNYVYAFAVQSWLIAALSASVGYFAGYRELYVIAALTALFRGLILPYLLMRIIGRLNVKRELHAVLQPS